MSEKGFAFFVKQPRRIDDLLCPHPIEQEREYEAVKTIQLSQIDYENFVTDMVADRQFLEDYANLCSKDGLVVRCLLVKSRTTGGVLVVPAEAWVDIAAAAPKQ